MIVLESEMFVRFNAKYMSLRVMGLMGLFFSSCTCPRQPVSRYEAPEVICELISPYNDPAVMNEWEKIVKKLHSRGISVMVGGSIGAAAGTRPQQADDARAIILKMIKDGEVNAEYLQLSIISPRH